MKRNLTAFFLCFTLLGSFTAANAEKAPDAPVGAVTSCSPAPSQESGFAAMPVVCSGEGAPEKVYFFSSALKDLSAYCSADPAVLTSVYSSGDESLGLNLPEAGLCGTETAQAEAAEEPSLPAIPIVVNKSVESFVNYFQTRGRKYYEKWSDRSRNYMTMLRSILKENGVPEDLSYIAFIESGINPTAKSPANAVGMWQFIKGTAKIYGLRVDWWVDERMDPEKATYAAAKYFKNLFGMFGDWYLAAASYNAGEGRVARAIKKHDTEDFWQLASKRKPLARETKEYVPKYLAALTIGKDPKSFGFDEVEYLDSLPYEKVTVSQATDLRVIAKAAGTSVEEIRRLNPELLRQFTPPNYPNYEVKIPRGASEVFAANMAKLPPAQRISFQMHKVRRGETIAKIAKKYGSTVDAIHYVNNLGGKRVKPGTVLAIPVRAGKGREMALAYTDLS